MKMINCPHVSSTKSHALGVKGWYPIHHDWNEDRWLFSLPTPIKEVQGWKNETTMRIPNFIPDFCLSFRRERQHSWPALEWSTCFFWESCCSILCACSGIKKNYFSLFLFNTSPEPRVYSLACHSFCRSWTPVGPN